MSDHEDTYGLVLAFDTNDSEFCRGFEAADVDNLCERFVDTHEDELRQTIHATNAEMMLRIAERHDLHVRCEELNDHWLEAIFTK